MALGGGSPYSCHHAVVGDMLLMAYKLLLLLLLLWPLFLVAVVILLLFCLFDFHSLSSKNASLHLFSHFNCGGNLGRRAHHVHYIVVYEVRTRLQHYFG